ncbi:AB hydrolase superfamily protein YisY [Paenibacillus baekrokdamisoli]|uniref:AB hydrolase superfamily protein YisY n=1 Tax=Paenibacillus baekrokdamisoli TaxID=1712516 RepID=A0A3G9JCN3_9BACL|nr:alpha/beta hydrolase [Paenibacillus baekrokdamisoli]MBB3068254.1 pimeloyl-ACP methyl ester carboxylesterase [Paenibacillus baekrokdamisoli]BBH22703.1 AB hydrolase superfamily protein YisY [Paenibacillus baekrokdamisoli]
MHAYIEVERGVRIYVEEIGQGKPVLFIHGWPINHKMYEYQINVLPHYGYRCIRVDLRGFGKSDAPWQGYNYNRMADDIRIVVEALRIENATLVGFSMGGAIAIRYITRHAAYRMSLLILASAAAPSFIQRPDFPYGLPREEVNALIASTYVDRPKMVDDFGKNFFASSISEPFRSWFNGLGVEASSIGTIRGLEALRDEDLRGDLPYVQLPTTILYGMLDKICPYPLAELLHRGIQHSRIVPFGHSGHGVFYDELEKFNGELLTALNRVTAKPY